MKKIATIIAAALLAFAITGCSSGASSSNASDASASGSEASDVAASDSGDAASASSEAAASEGEVIIGENAWSDAKDEKAAGEAAGFSDGFVVPNPLPIGDYKWSEPHFSSMENVAEANIDGGDVAVCIRKGEGVPLADLSADLNEYKSDWTQEVDGIKIACHGYEDGIANFLEWENSGCSYDVWCVGVKGDNIGMTEDEVAAMVAGIK